MTTYQLVPYLISVNVKGMPDETRALDDLFADGEQLADELGACLALHAGELYIQPSEVVRPLTLRVEHVGVSGRHLSATMSPGRSGVRSKIRKADGQELDRDFADTELVPLRHYLLYGQGAHRAILLAERVGGAGAITPLAALLKDAWRAQHPETVLKIDAAMAEEAWASSLSKRPVKGYRLSKSTVPSGNMAVGKDDLDITVDVRPARRGDRWKLKKQIKKAKREEKALAEVILREMTPILAPDAENRDEAAAALLDDGWQVAVTLELEGNVTRTVYVESNAALSMSFPIIEGENEPKTMPSDDDVVEAVKRIISDGMLAAWGLPKGHEQSCSWISEKRSDVGSWKAQWDVVDQSNTGTA